ncbi:MAG: hypothetical protein ACYC61_16885 [Isosphaeraceae bacterium]
MPRTTRRALAFESMEGRILLSHGMGHHPVAMHRDRAAMTHFLLNGSLVGIPFGTVGSDGINVSSFTFHGRTLSMGKVAGSLAMTDNVIAPGKQPDLSNATLTLGNPHGTVQIKTAASPGTRYVFIVTGGTGAYSSAYGSGVAAIRYNSRMHEYQLGLRSSKY